MMRFFFFIIAFVTLTVNAQERVAIINTHCSIVLPKGFFASKEHSQINNWNSALITIEEEQTYYKSILKLYNKKNLSFKGITLMSSDTLTYNNSEATFITGTQPTFDMYGKENGSEDIQILLFKGPKFAIVVTGKSPQSDPEAKAKIKEAMLTVQYAENGFVERKILYSIAAEQFGYHESGSNLYIKGAVPSNDSPIISVAIGDTAIAESQRQQSNDYRFYEAAGFEVINSSQVTVDGMDGFEIVLDKKDETTNQLMRIVQMTLFHDDGYFIISATVNQEHEKQTKILHELFRTFKRLNP